MKLLRATFFGLAICLPALCFAQWQWVDKDGHKVFSDQPPPTEVPAKNILRRPMGKGSVAVTEPAPAASSASQAKPAAAAPKLSGKDKELEDKKKLAEAAAADKKKSEEEDAAKVRAENCQRAKLSKATLDSGVRIAQTNAKGEREVMDDAARATENKRLEKIIGTECKVAGAQ